MGWTIRKKLYLSFGLLIVLLAGLSIYAQRTMGEINAQTVQMAQALAPRLDTAHRLTSVASMYRMDQYKYIAATAQERAQIESDMQAREKRITELIGKYMQITSQEKRAQVEAIAENWAKNQAFKRQVVQYIRENKPQEAHALMYGDGKKLHDEAMITLQNLANANLQAMEAADQEADVFYDAAMWTQMAVLCIAVLVALAIALWVSRGISRSLTGILAVSDRVGKGDLRENVPVLADDEIGILAKSYNAAIENSRQMMRKIQEMAERVASSSHELNATTETSAQVTTQISDAVNTVAREAENQTEEVKGTSAVVEQMSASIEEMAATATVSSDQATLTAEKAQNGNALIDQAVQQMNAIEQSVMASAAVVAKLGDRSKEIGQIVDTISGIAGQTNLLALNAAIEAARAGEQGKGFAVVAEEVRKLAEQSQVAAKQIETLIREIQGETESAVIAMGKGTEDVKAGSEVVDRSGRTFKEIVTLAEKVAEQSKNIAATIHEVAVGTEKIVSSVKGLDRVSQKVASESQRISAATEEQAASVENIADSSRDLTDVAQQLQNVAQKFRV